MTPGQTLIKVWNWVAKHLIIFVFLYFWTTVYIQLFTKEEKHVILTFIVLFFDGIIGLHRPPNIAWFKVQFLSAQLCFLLLKLKDFQTIIYLNGLIGVCVNWPTNCELNGSRLVLINCCDHCQHFLCRYT